MSRPTKVLVVDDSALVHKIYRVFLNKYRGCSVIKAKNGREGLGKLAAVDDIDLILLDINMPVMNGIQFLETIQRERALQEKRNDESKER